MLKIGSHAPQSIQNVNFQLNIALSDTIGLLSRYVDHSEGTKKEGRVVG